MSSPKIPVLHPRALYSTQMKQGRVSRSVSSDPDYILGGIFERAGERIKRIDPDGSKAIALFNEQYNRGKRNGSNPST